VAEPFDFDRARRVRDIAQGRPVDDIEIVAKRANAPGHGNYTEHQDNYAC
jgi:hypothetical protein